MNILIIGGTGLIGGHAALHLKAQGNDVTLAARKPPATACALAKFDLLRGDYVADDFARDDLARFDALVFAAGNDIRHLPPGVDEAAHWQRANIDAVPRFFSLARDAGVKRAVLVGSFYPRVAPALVETVPYVRSRHLADERVRALATTSFEVCSVNAPFVVGSVPGLRSDMFAAYTRYAQGRLIGLPVFGPVGGSNFMSTQSLSEAIWGALRRGEAGRAYLVGDENLSFADYFAAFFRAAGNPQPVPSLDQAHPLLPDIAIYTGRGNIIAYEPDSADLARLRYRRGDVQRAIDEVVDAHSRA
jgi:nucleoside-diphosphate-sugar epimerase